MPKYRRKRSCAGRKRPSRRAKRTHRRRRYARLPTQLVPASKVVRLVYCEQLSLNPPVGAPARYDFRANSIYDPDLTSTGHQPMGRDQWSAYYDHYTVIGSKITCKFTSGSVGLSNQYYVAVSLKDTGGQWDADINTACERNGTKLKHLGVADSANGAKTCTAYYSPRRFFGVKDISDNRAILGSHIDNNPTEDATFNVVAYGIDKTTDASPLNVMVKISYLVKFTERRAITGS